MSPQGFEYGSNTLKMDFDWINNMHWDKVATLTTNSWDIESTHDLMFSKLLILSLWENYVCCNLFLANKKCPIELDYIKINVW